MHVPNLVYSSTTNPQGHARMRLRDRPALAIKQIGIISVAVDRPKQIMIVAATPAPPTSPTARSGAWISTKLCTLNMLLIEYCNKCRLQMGVAMAPAHCFFLVCPCSSQTLRKLRRCGPLSRTLSGRPSLSSSDSASSSPSGSSSAPDSSSCAGVARGSC